MVEDTDIPEQPPVDNDHAADGAIPFTDEKIAANSPVVEPAAPAVLYSGVEVPSNPPSVSAQILLDAKNDGVFLDWAFDSSISFLELADLDPVVTVGSLRGQKEEKIRDKIQMANSMLVLLANYGSQNDNKELVSACTLYAEKMKTIIKRLCL